MKHANFDQNSLEALIKRRHFDCTNNDINNERFPTPNRIWDKYEIFDFKKDIFSNEAVGLIQADGCMPANSHELLLWKGWNGENRVIALDSVTKIGHNRFVLLLHGSGTRWHLFLFCLSGNLLPAGYSILAVRKP